MIRSVFAISVIGILLIAPFTALNVANQRWFIALASASVLIVCVYNVIVSYKGKKDLLCRVGGEEFVLLVPSFS